MRGREFFGRVAHAVTRRPLVTIAVVGVLALAGFVLALGLKASTGTDSLVGRSSAAAKATERFHKQFGDESIVVLVKGRLERSVLTSDLLRLLSLEGCISGNVPPQGLKTLPAVCSDFARTKPIKVVYGPGTFVNTSAGQIMQGFVARQQKAQADAKAAAATARTLAKQRGYSKKQQDLLASQASKLVMDNFNREVLQLGLQYKLTSLPALDNVPFVSELVFDTTQGVYHPKARFAYLFPSEKAALILVRLKPGLSDSQRKQAIGMIQSAVAEPRFQLQNGQQYIVTGVPVVVDSLASEVQKSIFVLLGAALLVMAATLMLVFRTQARLRLLPLALALAAAAMAYGTIALAGSELTMASIAALPVLIGLAVDYVIQLQARFDEARAEGLEPGASARQAAMRGAPTIAGAALATAAGFLVLLLSPIPMIHGFAVLVIVGIALALLCALTAGLAVLTRFGEPRPRPADLPPALPRLRAEVNALRHRVEGGPLDSGTRLGLLVLAVIVVLAAAAAINALASWIVALVLLLPLAGLIALLRNGRGEFGSAVRTRARGLLAYAVAEPRKVLAIGLALAFLGWLAETQIPVVSDVRQLVPQNLQALKDVNQLEDATGVSGEIDVTIHGDVLSPAAIKWITGVQSRVLSKNHFQEGETCLQTKNPPRLCPALSLTDLFQVPGSQASARELLSAVPPYFAQAVVTPDHRTATLAFGIRFMPLDTQEQVINDIRTQISHPPPGISAEVAGLPVLAADANAKLSSGWGRFEMLFAALAAVFLVLLALRRKLSEAIVPLIPIALTTGWSSLILFILPIPLNPMSATLGALVIAISTEFSILLSARYRQERARSDSTVEALDRAYASTGAAVLASGATAIAGFAAVIASDIQMLHEFGAVTVIDLTVSLLGVLLVLPASIVWAEQRGRVRASDFDPRPLARAAWTSLRGLPGTIARDRA